MIFNVLVADDHTLFRQSFITELRKYGDIHIHSEAANGDEVIQILQRSEPHVILLDISMPKVSGLEVLHWMRENKKDIKTVMVSMHDHDNEIKKCIEAGAHGFLSKDQDSAEVYVAIRSVMENGFYFNEKINKMMLGAMLRKQLLSTSFPVGDIEFSEKELYLIKGLSRELTTKEIAHEMNYSPRTVEAMRQEMIHRAGVKNAVGLILFALKHGHLSM